MSSDRVFPVEHFGKNHFPQELIFMGEKSIFR